MDAAFSSVGLPGGGTQKGRCNIAAALIYITGGFYSMDSIDMINAMDAVDRCDKYDWTQEALYLAAMPTATSAIMAACNELADQISQQRESDYELESRVLRAIYSRRNLVRYLATLRCHE